MAPDVLTMHFRHSITVSTKMDLGKSGIVRTISTPQLLCDPSSAIKTYCDGLSSIEYTVEGVLKCVLFWHPLILLSLNRAKGEG